MIFNCTAASALFFRMNERLESFLEKQKEDVFILQVLLIIPQQSESISQQMD